MRLENHGLSLWYCTSDAPGPGEVVPADADVPIMVGLSPPDASNEIEVHYRVGGGAVAHVLGSWFRNSSGGQYFVARLPAFQSGDQVEFWVTARCAGRYVPAPASTDSATLLFRVDDLGQSRTLAAE